MIAMVTHTTGIFIDLCLFRYHQEEFDYFQNCVLPLGIRNIIKDYVFEAIEQSNIRDAVNLWCIDRNAAGLRYGTISMWDVSGVHNMSKLFDNQATFNDDISSWNMSNVTNMSQMFKGAKSFN